MSTTQCAVHAAARPHREDRVPQLQQLMQQSTNVKRHFDVQLINLRVYLWTVTKILMRLQCSLCNLHPHNLLHVNCLNY